MPYPQAARDYLLKALDGTPDVLAALLRGASDAQLDRRPDPERFTLREMTAHVADWDAIWLERMRRIANENHPFLPSIDESTLAEERNYAGSAVAISLSRLRKDRTALVEFLKTLADDAWDRTGDREFVGVLTLQQQAAFALSHDGYHLRQAADFLSGE